MPPSSNPPERLFPDSPVRLERGTPYAVTLLDQDGRPRPWDLNKNDMVRCYYLWETPKVGRPLRFFAGNSFLRSAFSADSTIENFQRLHRMMGDTDDIFEASWVVDMRQHQDSYRITTPSFIYCFIDAEVDPNNDFRSMTVIETAGNEAASSTIEAIMKAIKRRLPTWILKILETE